MYLPRISGKGKQSSVVHQWTFVSTVIPGETSIGIPGDVWVYPKGVYMRTKTGWTPWVNPAGIKNRDALRHPSETKPVFLSYKIQTNSLSWASIGTVTGHWATEWGQLESERCLDNWSKVYGTDARTSITECLKKSHARTAYVNLTGPDVAALMWPYLSAKAEAALVRHMDSILRGC